MDLEEAPLLKALGLNQNNKWVLYDEQGHKFFKWLVENCDISSNVLPEGYESDEDEEEETEVQDIPVITTDQLKEKEELAEFLDQLSEERKGRIFKCEEIERTSRKDLLKIEEKLEETEKDIKRMSLEIQNKASKLEVLRVSNEKRMQRANKRSQPMMFMHQMPNDYLNTNLSNLLYKLESTMKQHFNVKDLKEINATPSVDEKLLSNLKNERDKLVNLERKKLEVELDLAGIRNSLKVKELVSCNRAEQRAKINEWNSEEKLLKEQLDLLSDEYTLMYSKYPPEFFEEFSQKKLKENLNELKGLDQMMAVTSDIIAISEVLWAASNVDLTAEKIEFYQDYRKIAYEIKRRIYQFEVMKSLPKEVVTVEPTLSHVNELLIKLRQEPNSFATIHNGIKEIDQRLNVLSEVIYSGPIQKPCLYDSKFFSSIYEKEKRMAEYLNLWKITREKIQKDLMEPYQNDKFYRMKMLLSIWFITEPHKVVLAIKEVQKKAAEEGSQSYKALNITIKN